MLSTGLCSWSCGKSGTPKYFKTEKGSMSQVAQKQQAHGPVTLIDAEERFHVIERKIREMEPFLNDISDNEHPGVMDLMLQYSMLRTSVSSIGERLGSNALSKITIRDLKMLSQLEILVYEFEGTLSDAHAELA